MALMDIAVITPLLRAVRRTLKVDGRFVFSVPHPCFNTNGTTLLVERDDYAEVDAAGVAFSVRVRKYLGLTPQQGIGISGQPRPHYYFHRPLSSLFGACFAAGLMLDGVEEPTFPPVARNLAARWDHVAEIPPILAARLRIS
jgi:hypothetical protein